MLYRDVVSVLKLAQPLWMFARMPTLLSSRVTSPRSRYRNFGKLIQTCRIQSALLRPILKRNEATSSEVGRGKIEAILGVEQRAEFAVDGLVRAEEPRCELLSLIVIDPRVNRLLFQ